MKTYDEQIHELTRKQSNVQYVDDMPYVTEKDIIDRATAFCQHGIYTQSQLDYILEKSQFLADDVNMVAECCTEKVPITSIIDKVMGKFNDYYVDKEYEVVITETLSRTVKVTAKSAEEAQEMVENGWNSSEYILGAEDFQNVKYDLIATEQERELPTKDKEPEIHPPEAEKRPSLRGRIQQISQQIKADAAKTGEVQHER